MFFHRGRRAAKYADGEIRLVPAGENVADEECGSPGGFTFDIYPVNSRRAAGYVSLRLGESPALYYLGHIGYRVYEHSRGHGYAHKAVRLLLPLMREKGLLSVVITTNEDNLPSRATCEKLGCVLERVAPVPERFRGLCMGALTKCRYVLLAGEGRGGRTA